MILNVLRDKGFHFGSLIKKPLPIILPYRKESNKSTSAKYYRDDLLKNIRSRNMQDRRIILEGIRLIQKALECNLQMLLLLYSEEECLNRLFNQIDISKCIYEKKIFKISKHDLKVWSVLTTPPGLLAVFHIPKKIESISQSKTLPITVICDNIREPSNLGSIIRTCAAIPCYQIIVMKGCCDPWETKVLRGSTGAHFHIRIVDNVRWETLPEQFPSDDYNVYIAENNLQKVYSYDFKKKKSIVTSVYTDIDKNCNHNVVVIGGETYGISKNAYRFFDNAPYGKFLHVPLAKGIESLNVASAITLILYEFRKSVAL